MGARQWGELLCSSSVVNNEDLKEAAFSWGEERKARCTSIESVQMPPEQRPCLASRSVSEIELSFENLSYHSLSSLVMILFYSCRLNHLPILGA